MKKNKPLIKDKERVIIQYIDEHGGVATANEIARGTGLSYVTVEKYLKKLEKEEIVIEKDGKKEKK